MDAAAESERATKNDFATNSVQEALKLNWAETDLRRRDQSRGSASLLMEDVHDDILFRSMMKAQLQGQHALSCLRFSLFCNVLPDSTFTTLRVCYISAWCIFGQPMKNHEITISHANDHDFRQIQKAFRSHPVTPACHTRQSPSPPASPPRRKNMKRTNGLKSQDDRFAVSYTHLTLPTKLEV